VQVVLADEATALLHGRECLEGIHQTAAAVFAEASGAATDLPTLVLKPDELANGVSVAELMVRLGFADSKNEARRLIKSAGVKLDEDKVTDTNAVVNAHMLAGKSGSMLLSVGKKKHAILTQES
jgi:tyrosyl-tRNA synthetase